jgi:Tfp pilus assembly protein PilF
MVGRRSVLLLMLLAWALSACSSLNSCEECWWFNRTSSHKLEQGISSYEEGNYVAAMSALNGVLQANPASNEEKVTAYKYLAFIHCVSGREKLCYESFRKALALNPGFVLTPAEIGHPVWGAVFRSAKAKSAK